MANRPHTDVTVHYEKINIPANFPFVYAHHDVSYNDGTSLHFHNTIELGYCFRGSGVFFVEDQIIPFSPGDITIIFPDQPHIAQSPDTSPSNWGFFSFDPEELLVSAAVTNRQLLYDLFYIRPRIANKLSGGDVPESVALIRLLYEEMEKNEPQKESVARHLLCALLLTFTRIRAATSDFGGSEMDSSAFAKIRPSVSYMIQHYAEAVRMDELAALCHFSTPHYRKLFKSLMNRSPLYFLREIRISMARSLLVSTTMPISEISGRVGFETFSSFDRCFRQFCHCSPADYRKSNRKTEG